MNSKLDQIHRVSLKTLLIVLLITIFKINSAKTVENTDSIDNDFYNLYSHINYGNYDLNTKLKKIDQLESLLPQGFDTPMPKDYASQPSTSAGDFVVSKTLSDYIIDSYKSTAKELSEIQRAKYLLHAKTLETILLKLKEKAPEYFGSNLDKVDVPSKINISKFGNTYSENKSLRTLVDSGEDPNINKLFDNGKLAFLMEDSTSNNRKKKEVQKSTKQISSEKKALQCSVNALKKWPELQNKILEDFQRKDQFDYFNSFISGENSQIKEKSNCYFTRLNYRSKLKKPNKKVHFDLNDGYIIDENGVEKFITPREFHQLISELEKTSGPIEKNLIIKMAQLNLLQILSNNFAKLTLYKGIGGGIGGLKLLFARAHALVFIRASGFMLHII